MRFTELVLFAEVLMETFLFNWMCFWKIVCSNFNCYVQIQIPNFKMYIITILYRTVTLPDNALMYYTAVWN